MSYITTNMTVTSLVTEEACTSEGLKMMLENCDRIAHGTNYSASVENCLSVIRKVSEELETDFKEDKFCGDYAVERHGDEVIFYGNVRVNIGNGYQAVMHWETLEHQSERVVDVVVMRNSTALSKKAARFDPYFADAEANMTQWIRTVAQAIGTLDA